MFRQGKIAALLVVPLLCTASAQAPPDARAILDGVRLNQAAADLAVNGRLRVGPVSQPFRMEAHNGTVTYSFSDPAEMFRLRFGGEGSSIEIESTGGKRAPAPQEYGEALRGTGITFQDLSLGFLYWPDATLDGEQIVGPRQTWKIRLRAPDRTGPYAAVIAFVDKSGGALLQMDAYDWEGKITRRFRVTSGQRAGDAGWMLKQMRVETIDPASGKTTSRTYIELDPPE